MFGVDIDELAAQLRASRATAQMSALAASTARAELDSKLALLVIQRELAGVIVCIALLKHFSVVLKHHTVSCNRVALMSLHLHRRVAIPQLQCLTYVIPPIWYVYSIWHPKKRARKGLALPHPRDAVD